MDKLIDWSTVLGADVAVDLSGVSTIMSAVALGLLAMWGVRKMIKTTNRS